MRDPKTHAKILALRRRDVVQAIVEAERQLDVHRLVKLYGLLDLLNRVVGRHSQETRWFYDPPTRMWSHVPKMPETEED